MDIIAVWLIDIVLFLFRKIAVCTVRKAQGYFILLIPRLL